MAVSTRAKVVLTVIGMPVLMVGAFGWVTWRQYEQAKMDVPLVNAIQSGDVAEVRRLLDSGADPNARDKPYKAVNLWEMAKSLLRRNASDRGENYKSALMVVSNSGGHSEIARLLLDHGAQVNARGPGRTTALLEAADSGMLDVLKLLLDRGADVRATNDQKQDAVLLAVKNKHEDCVGILLDRGGTAKAREPDGHTAMAWAVENELHGLFGKLLKGGASPDDKDANDKTALGSAIAAGEPEEVKLLLEGGANPNAPSEREPPLVHAYRFIDSSWGSDEGNVKPAVRREILALLLNGKADPNAKDSEGVPVLFRAMRDLPMGISIVKLLLEHGADANLMEKDQPALLEAVTVREPVVVRLLLEHGADLGAQDPEGATALMIAAFNADEEITRMLLNKGADPSTRDRSGNTALRFAEETPRIAEMIRTAASSTPRKAALP